jgi:hypothetical protein
MMVLATMVVKVVKVVKVVMAEPFTTREPHKPLPIQISLLIQPETADSADSVVTEVLVLEVMLEEPVARVETLATVVTEVLSYTSAELPL